MKLQNFAICCESAGKKDLSALLLNASSGVIRVYLWLLQSSNVLLRLVQ